MKKKSQPHKRVSEEVTAPASILQYRISSIMGLSLSFVLALLVGVCAYVGVSNFGDSSALRFDLSLNRHINLVKTAQAIGQTTGSVLGESSYSTAVLVGNRSLKINLTPQTFQNNLWSYKVDWNRTLKRQASLYIIRAVVGAKPLVSLDTIDNSGSKVTDNILKPSTRYKLAFYTQTKKGGYLLALKYFTTLAAPVVAAGECAQDVQACSDGSYVSRKGPTCSFAACPLSPITVPVISNLSAVAGSIGTKLIITGTGFTATGNQVNFYLGAGSNNSGSGASMQNLNSPDGVTLQLNIPAGLTPMCSGASCAAISSATLTVPGVYSVTVSNANGNSNTVMFTVTACGGSATADANCQPPTLPTISYLTAPSAPLGAALDVRGTGFTPTGNQVSFYTGANAGNSGNGAVVQNLSSPDGATLQFSVPNGLLPGTTYSVTVSNTFGMSNAVTFTVTENSSNSITVVSPAGGENWIVGQTKILQWFSLVTATSVDISLSPYIACLHTTPSCMVAQVMPIRIASQVPNTGSYSWVVGNTANFSTSYGSAGAGGLTGSYNLIVSDSTNSSASGTSNVFNISNP